MEITKKTIKLKALKAQKSFSLDIVAKKKKKIFFLRQYLPPISVVIELLQIISRIQSSLNSTSNNLGLLCELQQWMINQQ